MCEVCLLLCIPAGNLYCCHPLSGVCDLLHCRRFQIHILPIQIPALKYCKVIQSCDRRGGNFLVQFDSCHIFVLFYCPVFLFPRLPIGLVHLLYLVFWIVNGSRQTLFLPRFCVVTVIMWLQRGLLWGCLFIIIILFWEWLTWTPPPSLMAETPQEQLVKCCFSA